MLNDGIVSLNFKIQMKQNKISENNNENESENLEKKF